MISTKSVGRNFEFSELNSVSFCLKFSEKLRNEEEEEDEEEEEEEEKEEEEVEGE